MGYHIGDKVLFKRGKEHVGIIIGRTREWHLEVIIDNTTPYFSVRKSDILKHGNDIRIPIDEDDIRESLKLGNSMWNYAILEQTINETDKYDLDIINAINTNISKSSLRKYIDLIHQINVKHSMKDNTNDL